MNARTIALGFVSLITTSAVLGCDPAPSSDDGIVDVDELRSLVVELAREVRGDYYPRILTVNIRLPPSPPGRCAELAPTMKFTLNGLPALYNPWRGGLSPTPNFFGYPVCENLAGTAFRVPDEGGPLIVRVEQDGFQEAVIELAAPAVEPLALVAPADGHLRPGDVATVRVAASFYTGLNITPPAPHALGSDNIGDNPKPFTRTMLVARGQDLADVESDIVVGQVGVGSNELLAEIPSYTKPGPKSLYVAYSYGALPEPLEIRRCEGFATCTGQAREHSGVLGPVDVIVE